MSPNKKRKRPVSPAQDAAGASGSVLQDLNAEGQTVKEVIGQRRQEIKAALRGLVEAARPDLSPAQVDVVVAEINKHMTMGSKQSPKPRPPLPRTHFPSPCPGSPPPPCPGPPCPGPPSTSPSPGPAPCPGPTWRSPTTPGPPMGQLAEPGHPRVPEPPACWGEHAVPLELCSYEGLEALPTVGTEYQQGYKRVNDRLPK
ncbi:hypothetical protein QJQ45_027169 [Haematococcus lacustris]|nr:hypothetical protein QJQ45_027169 [Haematococcus lacustris]